MRIHYLNCGYVMQAEIDAAQERRGFIASQRYRPGQWNEVKSWKYYAAGGEPWFGFEAVRNLDTFAKAPNG